MQTIAPQTLPIRAAVDYDGEVCRGSKSAPKSFPVGVSTARRSNADARGSRSRRNADVCHVFHLSPSIRSIISHGGRGVQ